MFTPKTIFGKIVLPAAALSMSVLGLATNTAAHDGDDTARDLPLNCEIAVSKGRFGHTYEGVIHAASTVKGTYELNIRKRGASGRAMISQSGAFHVAAGKSETLGQATFGGLPPDAVDAELTLRWKGHELICSNLPDET